jgi:hypothetical protein
MPRSTDPLVKLAGDRGDPRVVGTVVQYSNSVRETRQTVNCPASRNPCIRPRARSSNDDLFGAGGNSMLMVTVPALVLARCMQ